MIIFARADGEIAKEEFETIAAAASKLDRQITMEEVEAGMNLEPRERLLQIAHRMVTVQHKRLALRDACLLCFADGNLDESEADLLEVFRAALGLPEAFLTLAKEWGEAIHEVQKAGSLLVEFGEDAFQLEGE
jgi:tellurite resistance protein